MPQSPVQSSRPKSPVRVSVSPLAAALTILVGVALAPDTRATDFYWSGQGASSDNIDQGDNWFSGTNPSSGDNLYFNNTAGARHWAYCNYGAGAWFNYLVTYSGAGGILWRGDKTYFYKFENNSDTSLLQAEADLSNRTGPDSDLEINPVGAGGITVSNVVMQNAKQIKVYGGNTLTVAGVISESGTAGSTLAILGGATVVLNKAATFTGDTYVNNGTLQFNTGGSLSGGTIQLGDTANANNATLTLAPLTGGLTLSRPIAVRSGNSGTMTISALNTSGTHTLSGGLTLSKALTVTGTSGGILAFSGGTTLAGNQLTVSGAGEVRFNGTTTATATTSPGIVMNGTGKLVMATGGDNTSLVVTANTGTTELSGTVANQTAGVTINSPATVRLNGAGTDQQIWNSGVLTINGGTFDQNGKTETVGTLKLYGGAISGSGTLTVNSAAIDAQSGSSATILAGTVGLTKSTTGTVTLSAQNTYSGGTTINAGILDLTGGGGGSGTIRGTVTINSSGTLRLSTSDATGYNGGSSSLTPISITGDTLNVNTTGNQTIGNGTINMTGGSITGVSGGNIDFYNGSSTLITFASATVSTISGPKLNLRQGNTTFTVAAGTTSAGIDLDISSVIQDTYGNGSTKAFTKAGTGTMRLTSVNTYGEGTVVSAGKLIGASGGSCANSVVTVNSGATNGVQLLASGGQWTCGGLAIAAGGYAYGDFDFGSFAPSVTTAPLQVSGNLVFNGQYGIIIRNTTLAVGTYPLIKYTGTLSGPPPTFPLSVPGGVVASITNNTATKSLDLVVSSLTNPTTATWAATSGAWDINNTANWTVGGSPATYQEGYAVLFNNPASASTVTLNTTVNPAAISNGVAFNNTANYTISGSGAIAGSAGVIKAGAGELILSTANTYSGGTIISAGIVRASGTDAAFGTGPITVAGSAKIATASGGGARTLTNPIFVNSGQTLSLDAGYANLTLNGPIGGAGSLSDANGGTVTLGGVSSIANAVTLSSSSTMTLASGGGLTNVGGGMSVATATLNVQPSSTLTTLWLRNGENANNGVINQLGGTVTLTTSSTTDIRLGHWGTTGNYYNLLGGTLNVLNTTLNNGWDGASTILINGGTANLKGLAMGASGHGGGADTLNFPSGTLNIGANGITQNGGGTKTFSVGAATLGALAAWTCPVAMTLVDSTTGTTFDTTGGAIGLSGALSGSGSLKKTGANTLTLSGANTYAGTTVISAGTLQYSTPGSATMSAAVSGSGTLAFGTGTTLNIGGSGNVASLSVGAPLTFSGGGTLVYDLNSAGSADVIAMTGSPALTLGATTTISPVGAVPNGTYTLISGAGTITGTAANLALATSATNSVRGTPATSFTVSSPTVSLTVSGETPTNLVWQGTTSGNWDVNTTANWINAPGGTSDKFFNADSVTFNDTATILTANGTNVTVSATVYPKAVTVNNSTLIFSISGSSGIAGGGTLTKSGAGTVIIGNANTFAGGTTISAGTVKASNASALGTGSLTMSGGVLDLNATSLILATLSATTGTITNSETAANTRTLTVNQVGNTTFAGLINTNGGGGIALVKNGSGYLTLSGANSYGSATTVSAGTLEVQNNASGIGKAYTVSSGATLKLGYSTSTSWGSGNSVTLNGNGVSDASGLYLKGSQTFQFGSTLTLQTVPSTVRAYGTGAATLSGGDVNNTHISVASTASGSAIDPAVTISCISYGYRMNVAAGANNATGDLLVGSVISGTGANNNGGPYSTNLRKEGTGSVLITNACTFDRGVCVNGGAVILAGGNNRLPATSGVILNSGTFLQLNGISQTLTNVAIYGTGGSVVGGSATASTLTINNAAADAYAGALGGAGANQNNFSLVKSGGGLLTLSGTLTYTGNTTISAGTVLASSLTNLDGATLSVVDVAGTLSATNLTLGTSAGSTVAITGFASATSAPIVATNLTVKGSTTITLSGTFTSGQYPLIQSLATWPYAGGGSFTVQQSGLPRGVSASIVTNDANHSIDLQLTANSLVWVGNLSPAWDVNTSANWAFLGVSDVFQDNDNVRIDDTAAATTLNLTMNVNPFAVLVTNSAKDLTISATGASALTGGMVLTKQGTGLLTMTSSNAFTGGVTISGGAVNIQNGYAFNNNTVTVNSGAELEVQGGITVPAVTLLTLKSTGTNNTGGLRNRSGNNTYGGAITANVTSTRINSDSGTLTLTGGVTAGANPVTLGGSGTIAISTTTISGSGGLVKDGSGTNIWSLNPNISSGGVTVNNGTFQINSFNFGGTFTPTITVNQNGTLWGTGTHATGGGAALVLNQGIWLMSAEDYKQNLAMVDGLIGPGPNLVSAGADLRVGSSGGSGNWTWYVSNSIAGSVINSKLNTIGSGVNLSLNVQRGAAASDLTVNGVIANGGTLTFTGNGITTLTATNTYTGTTTISAGVLSLGTNASIATTPTITIGSSGSLIVTNLAAGSLTLGTAQTLKGNGTVIGNTIIKGTIAAGSSIGTLTNAGNLTWAPGGTNEVEIGSTAGTPGADWDLLSITGDLNVTVTNNTPNPANRFTIRLVSLPGGVTNLSAIASNLWPIATVGGTVIGFNAGKFNLDTSGITNAPGGSTFSVVLLDKTVAILVAPACSYTTTNWFAPGPGNTMVMTFSNFSGLASVQALTLSNCTLQGTAYDSSSTALFPNPITPITLSARNTLPSGTVKLVLTATKVNPDTNAAVNALVIDTCGRGQSFDPVITTLTVTSGQLVQQRFEGLLSAEHFLHVVNGTPGLKWLEINLNGRVFRLDPLANGQDVSADLWSAMHEGNNNIVILTGRGDVGASALVMITDTASGGLVALPEIVTLGMSQTANGLVLSWPDTLTGWQLQASATADAGWTTVTTAPLSAGGQLAVTVPATDGAQFYRLAGPAASVTAIAATETVVSVPTNNQPQATQLTYEGILW